MRGVWTGGSAGENTPLAPPPPRLLPRAGAGRRGAFCRPSEFRLCVAIGGGLPFRRNGIGVPAQRHHRSGETAPPFRRNHAPRLERSRRAKRGGQTGESRFSGDICLFYDRFRLKTQTNGHFHACDRSVLVPMRIFSHRHENLFSWARESRLFVASRGRPTVRSGKGTSSALAPSIILPIAQNTLSPLLIYRANPGGLAEVGDRPSRRKGVALREDGGVDLREQPDNRPRVGPEDGPSQRQKRVCAGQKGGVFRQNISKRPRSFVLETTVFYSRDLGLLHGRPWSPVHGLPKRRVRPGSSGKEYGHEKAIRLLEKSRLQGRNRGSGLCFQGSDRRAEKADAQGHRSGATAPPFRRNGGEQPSLRSAKPSGPESAGHGRLSVNTHPCGRLAATVRSPPIRRANSRDVQSPMPKPPFPVFMAPRDR